ncbi:unnamed protein product [Callosobruchus maculatus]|uniref:Uncharacterized protein n=1 Tax=Callosobruchus maculatus TaxID=64391 RepID=A0A653C0J4_CALMS|nr:unnamed protein product [Callosobruchus maculatus]
MLNLWICVAVVLSTVQPFNQGYQRLYIVLLTEIAYLDFSYKCKAFIM